MTLKILIHNVGHGQAIHAFSPVGETIVIDLGCSKDFSPLKWLRRKTDTIDLLVITHPHGDHIDEILLLNSLNFKVRQLWRPQWLPKERVYSQNQSNYTEKLARYFEMSDRKFTSSIPSNKLVGNPAVSGGVSIQKFASQTCGTSNINNHSGVVIFNYLEKRVIIPGDNEPPSWRNLLEQQNFFKSIQGADIFMASHHGRKSGFCSELFEDWKPKLCVVSDGRVQDTDATARYSYHASGWNVHSRGNSPTEKRYCVTTRSNGYVDIEIGKNRGGNRYLSVKID